MRIILILFLGLLFVASVFKPYETNFLLITIDTWRSDYFSFSGSNKVKTPFLDEIARDGVYFNMDTTCPMTTPAHSSILTGLYPNKHGVRDNRNFKIKDNIPTLATLFKEKGYKTFAVVSGVPLQKKYGLNRDFDIYDDDEADSADDLTKRVKGFLKNGEQVVERASKILEKEGGKIFLWLHFYDPHHPYKPPSKFLKLYPNDPYAGEVAYVDSVVGNFLKNYLKGNWTIIIVGDHGEDLNEHGEETHGILLYNTTRKVPFILYNRSNEKFKVGKGAKSIVDILPTVTDIFSLKKIDCDGVSIFKDTERFLFSETFFPLCFGLNLGFSVKKGDLVFIQHGTSKEIYIDDFKEKENIISKRKDFLNVAENELQKYIGKENFDATLKMSEEELKTLKSLGYIGSSSLSTKMMPYDLRAFAKDFSDYLNIESKLLKERDIQILINEYDRLLKKYPFAPLLHCDKAGILIKMKRYDEALNECKLCVMLDKNNSTANFWLGNLMAIKGKFREAEKFYQASISLNENNPIVHYNIGMLYYEKLGNKQGAINHLKRFLELDPESPNALKAKMALKDLK